MVIGMGVGGGVLIEDAWVSEKVDFDQLLHVTYPRIAVGLADGVEQGAQLLVWPRCLLQFHSDGGVGN